MHLHQLIHKEKVENMEWALVQATGLKTNRLGSWSAKLLQCSSHGTCRIYSIPKNNTRGKTIVILNATTSQENIWQLKILYVHIHTWKHRSIIFFLNKWNETIMKHMNSNDLPHDCIYENKEMKTKTLYSLSVLYENNQ